MFLVFVSIQMTRRLRLPTADESVASLATDLYHTVGRLRKTDVPPVEEEGRVRKRAAVTRVVEGEDHWLLSHPSSSLPACPLVAVASKCVKVDEQVVSPASTNLYFDPAVTSGNTVHT